MQQSYIYFRLWPSAKHIFGFRCGSFSRQPTFHFYVQSLLFDYLRLRPSARHIFQFYCGSIWAAHIPLCNSPFIYGPRPSASHNLFDSQSNTGTFYFSAKVQYSAPLAYFCIFPKAQLLPFGQTHATLAVQLGPQPNMHHSDPQSLVFYFILPHISSCSFVATTNCCSSLCCVLGPSAKHEQKRCSQTMPTLCPESADKHQQHLTALPNTISFGHQTTAKYARSGPQPKSIFRFCSLTTAKYISL